MAFSRGALLGGPGPMALGEHAAPAPHAFFARGHYDADAAADDAPTPDNVGKWTDRWAELMASAKAAGMAAAAAGGASMSSGSAASSYGGGGAYHPHAHAHAAAQHLQQLQAAAPRRQAAALGEFGPVGAHSLGSPRPLSSPSFHDASSSSGSFAFAAASLTAGGALGSPPRAGRCPSSRSGAWSCPSPPPCT